MSHRISLLLIFPLLVACFSCNRAVSRQAKSQVIDLGHHNQILLFRSVPARRVTVVPEGGGFWPVVVRLNEGLIVAVLRGGDAHVGVKGRLDLVFSRDEGESWSAPVTAIDGPVDDRNPALGVAQDGTLVLAYVVNKGYGPDGKAVPPEKWGAFFDGIYVARSRDQGKTWDRPAKIEGFPSGSFHGSPYGKIIRLKDGSLLMTFYAKDKLAGHPVPLQEGYGSTFFSYVIRSRDGGKTWGEPSLISPGFNEVGLLLTRDNRIVAALRSNEGRRTDIAISEDEGRTWSTPQPATSNQEHPGDLVQLADGRIILNHGERNRPMGIQAMVSHDGGKTWNQREKLMLSWLSPNRDTGYPSSILRKDGKILTLYYQVDDLGNSPQSARCMAVIWEPPADW